MTHPHYIHLPRVVSSLAIGLWRPVVFTTVHLRFLQKQYFPQAELIVLWLRSIYICNYCVDPPDSVALNHPQCVEELLKLGYHCLLPLLIAIVGLSNEHVGHQHARTGNEVSKRERHPLLHRKKPSLEMAQNS